MEQTDEELISAYHNGETNALTALFNRYKRPVFNFALRMLNNRSDAEDVASEVFFQLFKRRYVYNHTAKLSTWLFAVARNACITRIRKNQNMVSLWFKNDSEDGFAQWDVPDTAAPAAENLNKQEMQTIVRRAINKLPLEQKEALILREYMKTNYADIAQVLGCSLEKVKVLIFRARERLRLELVPYIKEGQ